MKRREATFIAAALFAQIVLALRLRAIAWPEVTTPAYLWSRGLLLYRDVKFVHTPGMMAILAVLFKVFGPTALAIRAFTLIGPLLAHLSLIAHTHGAPLLNRAATSLFFLAFFYGWQGNSVWPVPLIAALALPLVDALENRRFRRAGVLLGVAILLKQTTVYVLVLVLIRLLLRREFRKALSVTIFSSAPYVVVGVLFAAVGAGLDYFRWTLVVPFVIAKTIVRLPDFAQILPIFLAFVPLITETALAIREDNIFDASWLLVVSIGLSLLGLPRFAFLQIVAAVPCLALGAFRWMSRKRPLPIYWLARSYVLVFATSFGATIALGENFDQKITYWNEDPAFEELVSRLRARPPGPLHSLIWPNLLPRTRRLPPAGLYALPWFYYYPGVDQIGERVIQAAREGSSVTVTSRARSRDAEQLGPYSIWQGDGDWYPDVSRFGIARVTPSAQSRSER